MGHWEQIGRDNAEERARRAAWPWWRRALLKHSEAALIAAAWVAAGAVAVLLFLNR